MKTVKELRESFDEKSYNTNAYCNWYKDAIEQIFNDIVNSQPTSVESVEKYLQDLLNN